MTGSEGHRTAAEPRVLLTGEKDGRWAANGKTVDELLVTGVMSWVYAFNGDYVGHRQLTPQDLQRYDLVIANLNRPLAPLLRLAQARPASLRWVSLVEGPAHEYFGPEPDLKALLDASDLVNVINRHSLPLFQALTRRPVAYIGIPYPVDGVRQLRVPIEARRRRVFLCAHLTRQWNEYLVGRTLDLPCYGYAVRRPPSRGLSRLKALVRGDGSSRNDEAHLDETRALYRAIFPDEAVGVVSHTKDMKRYFLEHRDALFWISLDSRHTWSRFVLDAAALGMPMITTAATSHGVLLFPETTVTHAMELDRVTALGRQLIADREFYDRVATYPEDKLEFLRPGPMTRALLDALSRHS